MPQSLLATPENPPQNFFNPTLVFDLTPQSAKAVGGASILDSVSVAVNAQTSIDEYLQATFDYLNRRLGLNNKEVSLKPMIGFDLIRSYAVSPTLSLVPEIYAVYRYDAVDDNVESRILSRDMLQAGLALGLKTNTRVSASLRFDSDLQPGGRDHRLLLAARYNW
jgi:hypothetical protein